MSTKHLIQLIVAFSVIGGVSLTLIITFFLRKTHHWAALTFKILGSITLVLAILFLLIERPDPFFNPNDVPQLITANVVDVSDIYMVSKYRSGAGHDYSGNGETCRSMKHYLNVAHDFDPATHEAKRSQPTPAEPNILIHAPFNGMIGAVGDSHLGKQVNVTPWRNPFYSVRLDHIDLNPGFHIGSIIKSGEVIGSIGPHDGLDVTVSAGQLSFGGGYGHLASYFQVMTDQVFAPWAALGYERDDFIFTKEYRDTHPLQCSTDPNSDSFIRSTPGEDPNNWVFLRPDPIMHVPGIDPIDYGPPTR